MTLSIIRTIQWHNKRKKGHCWNSIIRKNIIRKTLPLELSCAKRIPLCTEMTATFDLALEVKGQFPTWKIFKSKLSCWFSGSTKSALELQS